MIQQVIHLFTDMIELKAKTQVTGAESHKTGHKRRISGNMCVHNPDGHNIWRLTDPDAL